MAIYVPISGTKTVAPRRRAQIRQAVFGAPALDPLALQQSGGVAAISATSAVDDDVAQITVVGGLGSGSASLSSDSTGKLKVRMTGARTILVEVASSPSGLASGTYTATVLYTDPGGQTASRTIAIPMQATGPAPGAGTLHELAFYDTSGAGSTGWHMAGLAFEKGQIPAGSVPRARRKTTGDAVTFYYGEENFWSDGSLKKIAFLQDVGSVSAGGARSVEYYAASGTKAAASGFDFKAWVLAQSNALKIEVRNRIGSLVNGSMSDLDFDLKTAAATASRWEVLVDSGRWQRIRCWQKLSGASGDEHLICVFHVDVILNAGMTAPDAMSATAVMRLPYAVDAPFGLSQARQAMGYTAALKWGATTLQSYSKASSASYAHTAAFAVSGNTGWVMQSGWSLSGGKLVKTSGLATAASYYGSKPPLESWIQVTITVTRTTGTLRVKTIGTATSANYGPTISASGTYTFWLLIGSIDADAQQPLEVLADAAFAGEVTALSYQGSDKLIHAQHCSWAALRLNNDHQHACPHWIDLSGGSNPMPTLRREYSRASLESMARAGYVPPYDIDNIPIGAFGTFTYNPGGRNYHRGAALAGSGYYAARGMVNNHDLVAICRQTADAWRRARVGAQAGLSYYFDVLDHRVVDGDRQLRLIPTPVASTIPAVTSWTGLGAPLRMAADTRSQPPTTDLTIAAADQPNGAAWWNSADSAHWPDPSYFMAFADGQRYLVDAQLGSFGFARHYSIYDTYGGHNQFVLARQINDGRSKPTKRYGQVLSYWQERNLSWRSVADALMLMPDSDPHKGFTHDFIKHHDNWLGDTLANCTAGHLAKGHITGADDGGYGPDFGALCLWMVALSTVSLYTLWRAAEPVGQRSNIKAFAEQGSNRILDAWNYNPVHAYSYRDSVGYKDNSGVAHWYVPEEAYCMHQCVISGGVVSYTNITNQNGGMPREGDVVYLAETGENGVSQGIPTNGRGTRYYVRNPSAIVGGVITFGLATSPGGTPVALVDDASCGINIWMSDYADPGPWGSLAADRKGIDLNEVAVLTYGGAMMAIACGHPKGGSVLRDKIRTYHSTYGNVQTKQEWRLKPEVITG